MYTISNKNEINETLAKYIKDINLHSVSADDTIFVLQFASSQRRIKSDFTVTFRDKKMQTSYIKTKSTGAKPTNYYLMVLIFLVLILIIYLIGYHYRIKNLNITVPDSETILQTDQAKPAYYAELTVFANEYSKKFILTSHETTIGRNQGNSIVIPDTTISANHSKITFDNKKYYIEDLESTNGTLVNGVRITKKELKHKDFIKIGIASARFNFMS